MEGGEGEAESWDTLVLGAGGGRKRERKEENPDVRILEARRVMGIRKLEVITRVGSCKTVQNK